MSVCNMMVRTACLSMLVFSMTAVAVPSIPYDPNAPDCQKLDQDYSKLDLAAAHRLSECMRQDTNIGPGLEYDSQCRAHSTVMAWPQCSPISHDICEIGRKKTIATTTCWEDAARQQANLNKIKADAEEMAKKSHSAYKRLRQAQDAINDPQKFLATVVLDKVRGYGQNFAERLYDTKGYIANEHLKEANGLYKYAASGSESALRQLNPGLISAIQIDSLHRLTNQYAHIFSELDNAFAKVDTRAAPASQVMQTGTSPGTGRTTVQVSPECDPDRPEYLAKLSEVTDPGAYAAYCARQITSH